MQNTDSKTPTQANYRVLDLIEQMVSIAPKGTALGLCDLISAMFSGYFIDSGGAAMPAVEEYLRQHINDENKRAARSRRSSKALTYGQYNLNELIDKLQEIVQAEGKWKPIMVPGYRIVPVDFTAYRRTAVEKLKIKAYFSDTNRAVPAVPIGMIASVGEVNGQRVALLKNAVFADLNVNDSLAHKKHLYKQVAISLDKDELAVFDAGFKLAEAAEADIERCLRPIPENNYPKNKRVSGIGSRLLVPNLCNYFSETALSVWQKTVPSGEQRERFQKKHQRKDAPQLNIKPKLYDHWNARMETKRCQRRK